MPTFLGQQESNPNKLPNLYLKLHDTSIIANNNIIKNIDLNLFIQTKKYFSDKSQLNVLPFLLYFMNIVKVYHFSDSLNDLVNKKTTSVSAFSKGIIKLNYDSILKTFQL